jgi:hypothetical protein
VQLFVAAAAPPGLVSSLGWDIPSASAAAAADAPATVATLAAFNLTLADLLAAQSSLAPAAGDGGFGGGIASQAAAMLGVQSPALDAALSDFLRNPLNTSQWSVVADAAVAGLLNRPPSNTTADDASNSTGFSRFSVSGILGYNGPIPIPALDEFIGAHVIVRGLFSRYEPAWAAYRAVKDQLGFNPLGNLVELGGVAFVPATPEVTALAAALARRHVMWAAHYKGAHADVATARDAAVDGDEVVGPWAVVVFDEVSAARLSYTIRMRYTVVPGTDDLTSRFYKGLGSSYLKYITSGFLSLQRALDEAALDGALGVRAGDDPCPAAHAWRADARVRTGCERHRGIRGRRAHGLGNALPRLLLLAQLLLRELRPAAGPGYVPEPALSVGHATQRSR